MELNELFEEIDALFEELTILNASDTIFEETELYGSIKRILKQLDKSLEDVKKAVFNTQRKDVKESVNEFVRFAKKAGNLYNTNWKDPATQNAIYKMYNIKVVPMVKKFIAQCERWNMENDDKLPLAEIKAALNAAKSGDESKAHLESEVKKVFNY